MPAAEPTGGKRKSADAAEGSAKPKRSHLRRWVAAGLILGAALLTVAFVANAIKVNELLAAVASVEEERNGIRQENERLRAELLRLMSVEQVTRRATELGMVQPDAAPIALPLNGAGSLERKEGTTRQEENTQPQENEEE
jgi:hypothetical protein